MSQFKTAIKIFLFMTILTGVIYPILITLIAQVTMPNRSNGSLVRKEDQIVGSLLISQNTMDDRYFWPRPSAIDYDPIKPSGGSNLGPTSQKLKDTIKERMKKIGNHAPSELLYASGSGLDPHISLEAAYFQIPRVAKARSIKEDELRELVDSQVEGKLFRSSSLGYINVLLINQALDDRRRG